MELVETHRPKDKVFKVGQLLKQHGHEVVRLPPNMCELNAIELT
jgi:transposase